MTSVISAIGVTVGGDIWDKLVPNVKGEYLYFLVLLTQIEAVDPGWYLDWKKRDNAAHNSREYVLRSEYAAKLFSLRKNKLIESRDTMRTRAMCMLEMNYLQLITELDRISKMVLYETI